MALVCEKRTGAQPAKMHPVREGMMECLSGHHAEIGMLDEAVETLEQALHHILRAPPAKELSHSEVATAGDVSEAMAVVASASSRIVAIRERINDILHRVT